MSNSLICKHNISYKNVSENSTLFTRQKLSIIVEAELGLHSNNLRALSEQSLSRCLLESTCSCNISIKGFLPLLNEMQHS